MTDLKPDHPAVRAANMGVQEWLAGPGPFDDDPVRLAGDMTAVCITAALPHLTSATEENIARLRDTDAGRALMAEVWEEVVKATNRVWDHAYEGHPVDPDFPYDECQTCDTTHPYMETPEDHA